MANNTKTGLSIVVSDVNTGVSNETPLYFYDKLGDNELNFLMGHAPIGDYAFTLKWYDKEVLHYSNIDGYVTKGNVLVLSNDGTGKLKVHSITEEGGLLPVNSLLKILAMGGNLNVDALFIEKSLYEVGGVLNNQSLHSEILYNSNVVLFSR